MTPKQRRFVEEYLKDSNATQAAIRAGYSARSAAVEGSRLLTKANIAAAVKKARDPVLAASQLTLESHLATLAALRDKSVLAEQFAAAISAEISRGKVAGLYVEQHRDVSKMTDEELEAIIAGRAKPALKLA